MKAIEIKEQVYDTSETKFKYNDKVYITKGIYKHYVCVIRQHRKVTGINNAGVEITRNEYLLH